MLEILKFRKADFFMQSAALLSVFGSLFLVQLS